MIMMMPMMIVMMMRLMEMPEREVSMKTTKNKVHLVMMTTAKIRKIITKMMATMMMMMETCWASFGGDPSPMLVSTRPNVSGKS